MIGPKVNGKPRFQGGPITAKVSAAILAGQLGTADSANPGFIKVAVAGSIPFGVATTSGLPAGTSQGYTSPAGYPGIEPLMPDNEVAFNRRDAFYLAALGTFAYGEFVKCGAAGGVVKWTPGTDGVELKVGQCIDPAGGTNGTPSLIDLSIG